MSRKIAQNGPLPKGWREVRLGEIGKFSKGSGITKSEVMETGAPCIRYGELYTTHHLKVRNFYSFISNKNLDKRKLIKNNDLLFAGSGETREEIGKCASFNYDIKAYAGGDIIICSLDPKEVRADFASCYLNTIGRKQINRLGQGNSIVHIYSRYLEDVVIPLPSIEEQKAIASLLEKWDTAIEKTEALIDAKEKRFKWLITRLIAQSCKHWNHYKANELFKNISCKGYPDEELLSVTQDRGVIPRKMLEGRVMSPTSGTNSYKLVEPGNFAISLRSFQGGLEYSKYRGIISPAYTVLLPKKRINDDFYRHFFKTYIFVEKYLAMAVIGIRDGKQINFEAFKSIKLPLPPLSEQQRIAQILNTAQQEINLLKQHVKQYCTQQRGLMQKLLTGEWRVSNQ